MLSKKELHELLELGLETGADFSEIFFEDTKSSNLRVNNGEVTQASSGNLFGVGVRLLQEIDEVYGYSNDVSYQGVKDLVLNLRGKFSGQSSKALPIGDAKPFVNNIKIPY